MHPKVKSLLDLVPDQVAMTHRFVACVDDSDYNFGSWSRVSGLEIGWEQVRYRPGEQSTAEVFGGALRYQPVKLARAACADSAAVKAWLTKTAAGRTPLSGAIHMVDYLGMPIITWELKQFFPISWSITGFDSASAQTAVEELALAHSGFLDDERRTS
ncbi:phage tail protein [Actinophytocola glycyrrhizae]|uniref:Phage tail protein n=1 Tax=Actinophytocola glycyrrhizae TaxID=2044873 RepID=A0ABV9S6E3_9PSEU